MRRCFGFRNYAEEQIDNKEHALPEDLKAVDEKLEEDFRDCEVRQKECAKGIRKFLIEHRHTVMDPDALFSLMVRRLKEFSTNHKSKTTKADDFFYKVIDSIEDGRKKFVEDLEYDVKEAEASIDKFIESAEESLEQLEKGAVDYLRHLLKHLFIAVMDKVMDMCFKIQDVQIHIYDFWSFMYQLPVLGHFFGPPPTNWDGVLAPTSSNHNFYNWALTVKTNPDEHRVVTEQQHILDLIEEAQKDEQNRKKIRVSSFRHSFSPLFSDTGKYIHGYLLPHHITGTDRIDTFGADIEFDPDPEPKWAHIKGLPETTRVEILEGNKLRVHCGASNMTYTKLADKLLDAGRPFPSEPTNVLQLFQGFCGTHAVACHGGGIFRTTLCDYITKLTVFNYKGEKVVYEGDVLKKVASHLGLLGIVSEMEVQYDPQYLASFWPKWEISDSYFNVGGSCTKSRFQADVNESFYNEFFWWPMSEKTFANCWKRSYDFENVKRYPDPFQVTLQEFEEVFLQTANQFIGNYSKCFGIYEKFVAHIISLLGSYSMTAPKEAINCPSYDALHFQRGIQNMRVYDMEWVFPLEELLDENGDKVLNSAGQTVPDCSLCRDLWFETVKLYSNWKSVKDGKVHYSPQLLPLEMRIIRGSEVCLSAAHGSPFAVYIEVLTPTQTDDKMFFEYCQDLTNAWGSIAGTENMRPHWGKLWQMFTVNNQTIYEHLRETYKDDIAQFNTVREQADPHNIFMNEALGNIFLEN